MHCKKAGFAGYIVFAAIHLLILVFAEDSAWRMLTKIFMMPILLGIIFCMRRQISSKTITWLSVAVSMSWLGDIFLLFDDQQPVFFMLGLGAFLLAHIAYLFLTLPGFSARPGYLVLFMVATALYGVLLVKLLNPRLGELQIPVYIYAFALCGLLASAIGNAHRFSMFTYGLLTFGAASFVASDSILAFQKFIGPLNGGNIAVMSTYLAAQAFLVAAFLDNGKQQGRHNKATALKVHQ